MSYSFTCTVSRILLDLPHQVWEAGAADPAGQIFITRMFHNKIGFLFNNFLRCYLSYYNFESILITILFFTGAYYIFCRRSKLLIVLLIFPVPALLEIFPVIVRGIILSSGYIIVGNYGLFNLFSRLRFKNF